MGLYVWGAVPAEGPRVVSPAQQRPSSVSLGHAHGAALSAEGGVTTFALSKTANEYGELGTGDDEAVPAGAEVNVSLPAPCVALACGANHTAAVTEDGQLLAWGRYCLSNLPRAVALGGGRVVGVSCGAAHTAAVLADGSLWTFGYNEHGELGHGNVSEGNRKPRKVEGFVRDPLLQDLQHRRATTCTGGTDEEDEEQEDAVVVVHVAVRQAFCGHNHTLVIGDSGEVFSWGDGRAGQLGHLTGSGECRPRMIAGLELFRVVQCAAGARHSLFVCDDRSLWGCGDRVALGLGEPQPSLQRVLGARPTDGMDELFLRRPGCILPRGVVRVAAGAEHSLIATIGGQCLGCGYAGSGQLGAREPGESNVCWRVRPCGPAGLGFAADVYASGGMSGALTSDPSLFFMAESALVRSAESHQAVELWKVAELVGASRLKAHAACLARDDCDAVRASPQFGFLTPSERAELLGQEC